MIVSLVTQDTTVRWSASKAIARLAERLPSDYSTQILDSVLSLYDIHSDNGTIDMQDLPATSEATWHGATLACAELCRRGLVLEESLPVVLGWIKKVRSYSHMFHLLTYTPPIDLGVRYTERRPFNRVQCPRCVFVLPLVYGAGFEPPLSQTLCKRTGPASCCDIPV